MAKNSYKMQPFFIARGVIFNFVGQIIPIFVGIVSTPIIVHDLGIERFGLLTISWTVLGYFSILDFGLGQAATKFVSEVLGKRESIISQIIWTILAGQFILGFIGTAILYSIVPFLVRILNISNDLLGEAKDTFYLIAFSVPLVIISTSLRGVLEALQRFDLVNLVKIPANISLFLMPLIGVRYGFNLTKIVALILLTRIAVLLVFAFLIIYFLPEIKYFSIYFEIFPRLFTFGGWITIARVVGAILAYSDRFLIGSLLSVNEVAYYTAPFEMVTKLWIIPSSFAITLFPAFSSLKGNGDDYKINELFCISLKYLLIIQWQVILLIILFSREILQIWLGMEFSQKSTFLMQILALGVLFSSVAHIPSYFLQGIGRPDITAKFYLLELPIYFLTNWFLIKNFGIAGAAVAWTLRAFLDVGLLFGASFKIYQVLPRLLINNGVFSIVFTLLAVSAMAYSLKIFVNGFPLWVKMLIFAIFFSAFGYFSWKKLLNSSDKKIVLKMIMKREGL